MFSYEYLINENTDKLKANLFMYWMTVLFFIIVIFGMTFNKNINSYLELTGIVIDSNQVSVIVAVEDIVNMINRQEITVDKDIINYEIDSIKEEVINANGVLMKNIILNMSLNENSIVNNFINLKVEIENKNLFSEIFKYWRGKI